MGTAEAVAPESAGTAVDKQPLTRKISCLREAKKLSVTKNGCAAGPIVTVLIFPLPAVLEILFWVSV